MTNLEKYNKAFMEALNVKEDELNDELVYLRHDNWDSVSHMDLVVALEGAFNISLQSIEVTSLGSYPAGKEILAKHGIEIE